MTKEEFYNWLDSLDDYNRKRFEFMFGAESYRGILEDPVRKRGTRID